MGGALPTPLDTKEEDGALAGKAEFAVTLAGISYPWDQETGRKHEQIAAD
jgi:hypothetical protein